MIWILFGAVTLAVIAALFWASRPGEDVADRSARAMAIYEDQLAELVRDADRGVITEAEKEAAETEIKRRMLKIDRGSSVKAQGNATALLVAAVLVPMGAAILYFGLGRPDLPAAPYADRVAQAQELEVLTERLRNALLTDPEGGETQGWRLLATTYSNQGWFDRAVEAYRGLLAKPDANSVDFSRAVEAGLSATQGEVTPEIRGWIDRALELAPENPAGTFYLAYALRQEGDPDAALDALAARVAQETTYQNWMPWFLDLGQELAIATERDLFDVPSPSRGPTAEDVEAASEMSAADRDAMIRGMVDGLAARLQEEPEDIEGWLQLGRAYTVLGEAENARAAFEEVLNRTDEGDPLRSVAEQGLAALK